MKRIFRMKKMLERLEREGRMNEVDDEARAFMRLADGRTATDINWANVVMDEPLLWISKSKDFPGAYVNANDCE